MFHNQFKRVKNQVLATFIANIIVFSQGSNIGWFSPSMPILRLAESTPLPSGPLNDDDIGWIGSMSAFGSLFGTILYGYLISKMGLKRSLLLTSFPMVMSWLSIIFARNAWYIMVARFMMGFSGGGAFVCIPQFVAEIADDFVRGQLNAYLMMILYTGVLFGYIGGTYLSYYTNMWIMLQLPILFAVLFVFMPETPQYLLRNGHTENAENSMRFYRNCQNGVASVTEEVRLKEEFDKFKKIAIQRSVSLNVRFSDLITKEALKAFTISIALLFVNQWSGAYILSNYAATIFKETGSIINANSAAIVMGICQVFGYYIASQLMDRVGRRTLHIISTAGCTVALSTTGAFVYLVRHEYDLSAISWVPVISLSMFIFTAAIGVIPVPYIITTEVLPTKIRTIGVSLCSCMSFNFQFLILKLFPYFLTSFDLYGCMWMFAGVTTFGLLFSLFVVKETKGTNLDVLQMDECK